MTPPYRAAVVQMTSTRDKSHNWAAAESAIQTAADAGARLVALPELFNCLGPPRSMIEAAEAVPGPTSEFMSQLAARAKIFLLAGSLAERCESSGRVFNTSLLFGPDGQLLASYRKIHLFDVDLPQQVSFQESNWFSPGEAIVAVETELGRLGLATCYDLRFPELFRQLAERRVDVLLTPSAFTRATGRDHWEVLLRARAIENQVYVLAPNQFGSHPESMVTFGRSMIVDPWGTVMAVCPDHGQLAAATIDLNRLASIRAQLPALSHRRHDVFIQ